MAWLSELAGKAESLLNNLDEQTGAALRNHKKKNNPALSLCEIPNVKRTWRGKKHSLNISSPTPSMDTTCSKRNQRSARKGSPHKGSRTTRSPHKRSPLSGSTHKRSPSLGSPSSGSPHKKPPSSGSPHKRPPCSGSPHKGSPSSGSPHKGSPSSGSPHKGLPSSGSPHKGSPSSGSPHKGSPSSGSPHKGARCTGSPLTVSPCTGSALTVSPQSCRKVTNKKKSCYSLENPPITLVSNITQYELEPKVSLTRSSLQHSLKSDEEWLYKMQNLEIENIMLKNELNVTNKEFLDLMFRLRKSEGDNSVDIADVKDSILQLQVMTTGIAARLYENEDLQMNLPNKVNNEVMMYKKENLQLLAEVNTLRNTIQELEQKCKKLEEESNESTTSYKKIEIDLKHTQSTVSELQGSLDEATKECKRLEKDWEAYKLRVKNMLNAKDNQITSLQKGMTVSNETGEVMKTVEALKEEREALLYTTETIKSQLLEMQTNAQKMEMRQMTSERVLTALRDALRDERAIRKNAEAQYNDALKQIKNHQMESNLAMESLLVELREKNEEIERLQQMHTVKSDAGALNVADYDILQDSIENNKIQYLTQILVQKQGNIEKLIASNNTLKIQMQKLEKKYKAELELKRQDNMNVLVHEMDSRHKVRSRELLKLSALSVRMGVIIKRYPVVRMLILFYVICLHFWVITVLFTNTPDNGSKPRL